MADANWSRLEKENKPTVLAPVFKGAALERGKGKGSKIKTSIRSEMNNHVLFICMDHGSCK